MSPGAMKALTPMPKIRLTIIEAASAAIECLVIEKCSAVGFKVVVVKKNIVVVPVRSPMVPSPAKAAKETDAKTETEGNSRRRPIQARIPVPARPDAYRRSIHEPRIIFRHINDLGIGWFNHNGRSLLRHFFLRGSV